jgi:superfamily II DNA or RNA helicase
MPDDAPRFSAGSLVRARGREWIVLPGGDAETLRLRPLAGAPEDEALIHLPLELDPVVPARFAPPDPADLSGQDGALLLRDALLLSLRRGAGPFRSFGNVAVVPRTYQLVPLLMALKLDPVRLLIADDVGIGKTIEAGLVARELLDRGEVQRFAVLCPPHLVEQWVGELDRHFNLRAVPVTAGNAARLERDLPQGVSLFEVHDVTVVSLDYIKADRRRDDFVRACPELVIVDEAHGCTIGAQNRVQLRYQLLRRLADDPARHMLLLTATPHSGDEEAFHRLLGLLDRDFAQLGEAAAGPSPGQDRDALRLRLARHFVQRRRPDIEAWQHERVFARRETTELTYRLSGDWAALFDAVLDYCADVVAAAGSDERRQRLTFWGTLALMRCVASSPAAAAKALRTRAGIPADAEEEAGIEAEIFDGGADSLPESDAEPGAPAEDRRLAALVAEATRLADSAGDPKLRLLATHLEQLLADGFAPVVFCRYIATAHYLARHLARPLKGATIRVVTGELSGADREKTVSELAAAERRLLIATDCLSEGINLQDGFDAVVHYDLSWNPTRHEQREGRVDRYGQKNEVVRATLIYGEDNPVDGAVLQVILRKAEKIRRDLGVPVPLPDEGHRLTQALMRAVLLRRKGGGRAQGWLDFAEKSDEGKAIDVVWRDAAERAKANRTRFAQRGLDPEEVLPEWRKAEAALGGADDVARFVARGFARLGAAPAPRARGGIDIPVGALPEDLAARFAAEGLEGRIALDPAPMPARGCEALHRSHPVVGLLADALLERSLSAASDAGVARAAERADPAILGRAGCWIVAGIEAQTIVVLLRLRHQLTIQRAGRAHRMMVEEATAFGLLPGGALLPAEEALARLALPPAGDLEPGPRRARLAAAIEQVARAAPRIEEIARARAAALLADHRRVRDAAQARGSYAVEALLPADVIGVHVLLPRLG